MAEVTEYYDRRENNNNNNEDEISLLDLYLVLARRKRTIIITFAAVLLMCVAYLLLASKVYKTTVMILPPVQSELSLSNIEDASLTSFKSKEVFESIKSELKSKLVWDAFIEKNSSLFPIMTNAADGEQADNPLEFQSDKDYPGEHAVIQYNGTDKENLSKILNQFILFAANAYIAKQLEEEQFIINKRIISLETDIQFSKKKAKVSLDDEIAKLESDLKIAKKLGITDNQLVTIKNPQALTVVTSELKTPDYMRGVKVLTAVLEQLKQRQSNDAYITGLRDKQIALLQLQSIKLTPETFKPLRLDGSASKPAKIKPKAKLVLALGIVLGLMLGVFAAFFMEFFQKVRPSRT